MLGGFRGGIVIRAFNWEGGIYVLVPDGPEDKVYWLITNGWDEPERWYWECMTPEVSRLVRERERAVAAK